MKLVIMTLIVSSTFLGPKALAIEYADGVCQMICHCSAYMKKPYDNRPPIFFGEVTSQMECAVKVPRSKKIEILRGKALEECKDWVNEGSSLGAFTSNCGVNF